MHRRPIRFHWFLLIIPYTWDVLLIPWVNTIRFQPLGMPFLFLWMLCGIIVTSLTIAIIHQIDKRFFSQQSR